MKHARFGTCNDPRLLFLYFSAGGAGGRPYLCASPLCFTRSHVPIGRRTPSEAQCQPFYALSVSPNAAHPRPARHLRRVQLALSTMSRLVEPLAQASSSGRCHLARARRGPLQPRSLLSRLRRIRTTFSPRVGRGRSEKRNHPWCLRSRLRSRLNHPWCLWRTFHHLRRFRQRLNHLQRMRRRRVQLWWHLSCLRRLRRLRYHLRRLLRWLLQWLQLQLLLLHRWRRLE